MIGILKPYIILFNLFSMLSATNLYLSKASPWIGKETSGWTISICRGMNKISKTRIWLEVFPKQVSHPAPKQKTTADRTGVIFALYLV